jgi:hypothetical protein
VGVAATAARVLLPIPAPDVVRIGSVLLALALWQVSFRAVRQRRTVQFAGRVEAAIGLLVAFLLVLRLGVRLQQDAAAMRLAASPAGGNVQLNIARDLQSHGIQSGARIAVIGPHAESYWARIGRMHIVASVPRTRTDAFWQLSAAGRDSLLHEFAKTGATVAIASIGPPVGAPDSSWTPVKYQGWIRPLP